MIEGLAPNLSESPTEIIQVRGRITDRRGRTIETLQLANTPSYLQQIKNQTVKCFGVKLFNSLPKHIRNITNSSVDTFKRSLDKFLSTIEDLPLLQSGRNNGRANGSNHIFDCTPQRVPFQSSDNYSEEQMIPGVSIVTTSNEIMPGRGTAAELATSEM